MYIFYSSLNNSVLGFRKFRKIALMSVLVYLKGYIILFKNGL